MPFSQMFHEKGKAVLPTVQKVIQRFIENEGKHMYITLIEISSIEQRAMRWVALLKETCRFIVEVRMEKSNALSWAPLARHKASREQNRLNDHGKKLEEGGQRLRGHLGRLMLA